MPIQGRLLVECPFVDEGGEELTDTHAVARGFDEVHGLIEMSFCGWIH